MGGGLPAHRGEAVLPGFSLESAPDEPEALPFGGTLVTPDRRTTGEASGGLDKVVLTTEIECGLSEV